MRKNDVRGPLGWSDSELIEAWNRIKSSEFQYSENYAAALGRMLVRFNDLEARVGRLLELILKKLDVPHLYKVDDYYRQKVDRLELALCAFTDWPEIDFHRLRRINSFRNDLAHGHFAQDPISGEFSTRSIHRSSGKPQTITPEVIHGYSTEISEASEDVGRLVPFIWFEAHEDEEQG